MTDFKNDYHLVVPYFVRVVYHLHLEYKDISETLLEKLRADFYLFKKRDRKVDNILWDNRVRNIVFACECVKYRIISPNYLINCLEE